VSKARLDLFLLRPADKTHEHSQAAEIFYVLHSQTLSSSSLNTDSRRDPFAHLLVDRQRHTLRNFQ
jgi:hypothetical protein